MMQLKQNKKLVFYKSRRKKLLDFIILKGGIRYGRKRKNYFKSRNGRRIIKW